ncbi:MAG: MarR family winged helix-turn-helix transcriptional regulator [Anaerotignum sp.]
MDYDSLLLENQLCFPLYAASKEVVKKYKPLLDEIGLTYTQYIVMMVLWEHKEINVKTLGQYLYLDSGTLTPVLKKMEIDALISRVRSEDDERVVLVSLTPKGLELREKAIEVPSKIEKCVNLSKEDSVTLYRILHELLKGL